MNNLHKFIKNVGTFILLSIFIPLWFFIILPFGFVFGLLDEGDLENERD